MLSHPLINCQFNKILNNTLLKLHQRLFKTFYQIKINGLSQFLLSNYKQLRLLFPSSSILSTKSNFHKATKKTLKKLMLFMLSH